MPAGQIGVSLLVTGSLLVGFPAPVHLDKGSPCSRFRLGGLMGTGHARPNVGVRLRCPWLGRRLGWLDLSGGVVRPIEDGLVVVALLGDVDQIFLVSNDACLVLRLAQCRRGWPAIPLPARALPRSRLAAASPQLRRNSEARPRSGAPSAVCPTKPVASAPSKPEEAG